ncbi:MULTISPECIES: helix-turn-helix domain-containing protein [unclassified Adlercreutzia]|uniref:helix-turn-helix domain-containing protein n=1 Tax=unclassified Adlercreutzia TaxID=2636013 RepID=UPI0013EAAE92|nr:MULTISPECIES: helix-turn-helix transcriptional regulator [unclassified Adlercreutzia]
MNSNDYATIASNLRSARKTVGLSIPSAAYKTGLTPDDIYRYENGITPPSVEAFNKLFRLYNSYYTKFIFAPSGRKERSVITA